MPVDVPDLGRYQMEVIEQPFRRGGDELPRADIVGQRAVRAAQDAGIVVEAREDVPRTTPRTRVDGETCRERHGALFEPLDAEQLVSKRFVG